MKVSRLVVNVRQDLKQIPQPRIIRIIIFRQRLVNEHLGLTTELVRPKIQLDGKMSEVSFRVTILKPPDHRVHKFKINVFLAQFLRNHSPIDFLQIIKAL